MKPSKERTSMYLQNVLDFHCCHKIVEEINLNGRKVDFGPWFQSTVIWPHCFWPDVKQNIMPGSRVGQSCLPCGKEER